MQTDWMALAFERFQNAARSVRLTLPPCRDAEFWSRLVELARIRSRGLSITILLDRDPRKREALKIALQALRELEQNGHEVSWSAAASLPFSLFIVDDTWALIVAGNPDDACGISYVRLTDSSDETPALREAFDRIASTGIWGLEPSCWASWLDNLPHRKQFRSILRSLSRGHERLEKAAYKSLRSLPKRSYWLMKPRDSAWGIPLPGDTSLMSASGNHWSDWVRGGFLAPGWPALAELVTPPSLPGRTAFKRWFYKHYPEQKNIHSAYASLRHFHSEMHVQDRVAAVEGWTSLQLSPVRFHGWARIEGDPELMEVHGRPRIIRRVGWYRYDIDLPVLAVREITGLRAAVSPVHRLASDSFRGLIALAEEVRRNLAESQLLLDLPVNHNLNDTER